MSRQFRYIGPSVSRSTVEELKRLLTLTEQGELVGFAHIAIHRNREWSSGATGEAARNKALTSGLMTIETIALALDVIECQRKPEEN